MRAPCVCRCCGASPRLVPLAIETDRDSDPKKAQRARSVCVDGPILRPILSIDVAFSGLSRGGASKLPWQLQKSKATKNSHPLPVAAHIARSLDSARFSFGSMARSVYRQDYRGRGRMKKKRDKRTEHFAEQRICIPFESVRDIERRQRRKKRGDEIKAPWIRDKGRGEEPHVRPPPPPGDLRLRKADMGPEVGRGASRAALRALRLLSSITAAGT